MPERSPEDTADIERLRAWAAGDEAAGNALVERHFDVVFRFFTGKVRDPADLVQKTFLACTETLGRLGEVRRFRPYLLGIARNQLLMHLRKDGYGRRDLPLDSRPLPMSGPAMSGVVAEREEQRVLLVALRRLPIDLQVAVELFYWEGLGVEDIAEVLGAPVGTIKARLFRARKQLEREIGRAAGTPEVGEATVRHFAHWADGVRREVLGPEDD